MVNKQHFVELGLSCADMCQTLEKADNWMDLNVGKIPGLHIITCIFF